MTQPGQTNQQSGSKGWQDAIRCVFVAILSLSLVFQAQLSSSHMHWPDGKASQTSGDSQGNGNNSPDKRSDTKCFLCQQLVSAHNYLFSSAPFEFRPAEHSQRITFVALRIAEPSSSSFSWSSRAPPSA